MKLYPGRTELNPWKSTKTTRGGISLSFLCFFARAHPKPVLTCVHSFYVTFFQSVLRRDKVYREGPDDDRWRVRTCPVAIERGAYRHVCSQGVHDLTSRNTENFDGGPGQREKNNSSKHNSREKLTWIFLVSSTQDSGESGIWDEDEAFSKKTQVNFIGRKKKRQ